MAKKKAKKTARKKTPKKPININKRLKSLDLAQKKSKQRILIFILIIILIAALGYFLYTKGIFGEALITQCSTAECLIEKANKCEPAKYTVKIGTATIEMEILAGCKIKKKVLELDASEPVEIRGYFTGKEMICDYDKGEFDTDFAYQISGPLDECTGRLADAIKAVV